MRIAIDARMYAQSGIGRYIRNLLFNLSRIDKENEYKILLLKKDFENFPRYANIQKIAADFGWYGIAEQINLPKILNSLKPDLVHFPHFNVPLFFKGKFVVTIHDLIHQHFSMQRSTTHGPLIYKLKQMGYNKVFKNTVQKAEKILTPSNFVKKQLISGWSVSEDKITVTYEAADDGIIKLSQNKNPAPIKDPYIFYVGNAHPHKNIEGLINAFLAVKKKHKIKLVLSGNDHYFWQRIKLGYQDKDIIYTGSISDRELVSYYQNALLFVMPSFEEGFGIPLLEAFACSCPVASSNAGSLPEVGADAALYFDPKSPDDMADKISQVISDQTLRKSLTEKGLKRYKMFSWQELAKETLEVYKKCV